MKKIIFTLLLTAAAPLIVVSIVWVLTLGAFNYFTIVHSEPMIAITGFFTVLGVIFCCVTLDALNS